LKLENGTAQFKTVGLFCLVCLFLQACGGWNDPDDVCR